jgi:hypothetical protein
MKFVLDTEKCGLKIKSKIDNDAYDWVMVIYTDSNYAGDKDNQISVGGYRINHHILQHKKEE